MCILYVIALKLKQYALCQTRFLFLLLLSFVFWFCNVIVVVSKQGNHGQGDMSNPVFSDEQRHYSSIKVDPFVETSRIGLCIVLIKLPAVFDSIQSLLHNYMSIVSVSEYVTEISMPDSRMGMSNFDIFPDSKVSKHTNRATIRFITE